MRTSKTHLRTSKTHPRTSKTHEQPSPQPRDLGRSPHPPLRGHGADVPPAPLQTPAGLLDGVVICVSAGVGVVQQEVAERQHGRHSVGVLLDVPLELLRDTGRRSEDVWTEDPSTFPDDSLLPVWAALASQGCHGNAPSSLFSSLICWETSNLTKRSRLQQSHWDPVVTGLTGL